MTRSNQHRELTKYISHRSSLLKAARASSRPLSLGSLLLVVAFMTGLNSSARAQSLNPQSGKTTEIAAVAPAEGEASEGLMVSVPVPAPTDRQPEIVANPGRPAMATSALLTPMGYAQFESGLLYAADSAAFSNRSGQEETMRLTVAPFLQVILSSEPVAYSNTAREDLTQRGDATGGVQVVLMPGYAAKPTISCSYLHLIRAGTASSLDIGGYANSALLMASSDLGHFHVDANAFLNETEGPVRRSQLGQAVAVSHPLTPKLGATAELRYFTEPLTGGSGLSTLWAASYSIRPNFVLDTGLVHGFTDTSTRWQVASGITYVLPRRIWNFSRYSSRP